MHVIGTLDVFLPETIFIDLNVIKFKDLNGFIHF